MAALARVFQTRGMLSCGAGSILRRGLPAVTMATPNQGLKMSAPKQKREYGPAIDAPPEGVKHWKLEKAMSVALVPLIPAAVIFPNIILDFSLSAALVLHTHWGLSGAVTDYIHTQPLNKILSISILVLSTVAFAGLCFLNYGDIGLGRAVRKVYADL